MDIRVQANECAKAFSQETFVWKSLGRFRPRHSALGAAGSRVALPLAEWYFQRKQIHRSTSHFATARQQELAARLARGETAYLAGISIGGFHNSGVALIEVTPDAGLRIICNNEEERFSGRKHANRRSIRCAAQTAWTASLFFQTMGPSWLPGPRSQGPVSADGSENGLSIGSSKPVLAPRPDRVAAPTPGTKPLKGCHALPQ
jgi:hypothetical protein